MRSFDSENVIYTVTEFNTRRAGSKTYGEDRYIYFGIVKERIPWGKYQIVDIDLKYEKITNDGYVFFAYTDSNSFLNDDYMGILNTYLNGVWEYLG